MGDSRQDGLASVPDGERLARLAARENRLNDLLPRQWIKFQKSWFIHNPPAREIGVRPHPAKFPETLAQEFIEFFTKRGQLVFDPMAGTGSALIAALRVGRRAIGVELSPEFAQLAHERLAAELDRLDLSAKTARLIEGDARQLGD